MLRILSWSILLTISLFLCYEATLKVFFPKELSEGDLVRCIDEKNIFNEQFYSFCETGRVVYIYQDAQVVVEWSGCGGHPLDEFKEGFLDIHLISNLEKYVR